MPPVNDTKPSTPIAHELAHTPSRAFDGPPERPKSCQGCGGYHGSVGEGIHCLQAKLAAARAKLEVVRACKHPTYRAMHASGVTVDRVCLGCGAIYSGKDAAWVLPSLVRL